MFGAGRFIKRKLTGKTKDKNQKREAMLSQCLAYIEQQSARQGHIEAVLSQCLAYIEQQSAQQGRVEEALQLLKTLDWKLGEYCQANLFNQIALANKKEGSFSIYLPWSTAGSNSNTLILERLASGHLSFSPVNDNAADKKSVHILTIPK